MTHTVRLLYPQWQGGNIARLLPELDARSASTGYFLGARLLNFLAPPSGDRVLSVPVSTEYDRREADGVLDRDVILRQTAAAVELLRREQPDRIVTLGGECSVSVAPFAYLARKYPDDLAVIWLDAHPDITLPGDRTYNGYHAMAVSALLGRGDPRILSVLPAALPAGRILLAGLRDWEREEIKERQRAWGLRHLAPSEVVDSSAPVLRWLKDSGAGHIAIHFDLDVLDPSESIPAAGAVPAGLKLAAAARLINDAAAAGELVGLTVAEFLPRTAIRISGLLQSLPLLRRA